MSDKAGGEGGDWEIRVWRNIVINGRSCSLQPLVTALVRSDVLTFVKAGIVAILSWEIAISEDVRNHNTFHILNLMCHMICFKQTAFLNDDQDDWGKFPAHFFPTAATKGLWITPVVPQLPIFRFPTTIGRSWAETLWIVWGPGVRAYSPDTRPGSVPPSLGILSVIMETARDQSRLLLVIRLGEVVGVLEVVRAPTWVLKYILQKKIYINQLFGRGVSVISY